MCPLGCGSENMFTEKELVAHVEEDCKMVSVKCRKCSGVMRREECEGHDCIEFLKR
jgi:hypothetical protein